MCKEKKKSGSRVKGRGQARRSEAEGKQNKALSEDDEERIIGTKCGGWVRKRRGTLPDRSKE